MKVKMGKKIVGWIENGVYYTPRRPEHFFRKFQAFGISSDVMKDLLKEKVITVVFLYQGKDRINYVTTPEAMLNKMLIWYDGIDKQYLMPIKEMEARK